MNTKFWMILGAVFSFSGQVEAEVFGVTGDLDVGPARDYLSPTIVCKDSNVIFKMYEKMPLGTDDNARISFFTSFFESHMAKGMCRLVPASTAYVTGIRTAMIRKGKNGAASKYVVVKVSLNGENVYTTPNGLQQTGFEIIKAVQDENRRNGAPLVQ